MNIANLVNTQVADSYQPHGVPNHLWSVKRIKKEKEKGACHIKPF